MALQKDMVLRTGFVANYSKIGDIKINLDAKEALIMISVFKDKSARDAKSNPAEFVTIRLSGDDFPFQVDAMAGKNVYAIAYESLKQQEKFKGAQDV